MTDLLRVVDMGEFPHGLRCLACDTPLRPGDIYTARPNGMAGEDFVSDLVCIPCAEGTQGEETALD